MIAAKSLLHTWKSNIIDDIMDTSSIAYLKRSCTRNTTNKLNKNELSRLLELSDTRPKFLIQ